ncbi:MAG TPA: MFS transporter [Nocardioidaceae bacterium]|nr:MFS transporter [Nocardioidaceae bacterium]
MREPASARLMTPAFLALTLSDLAYFTASGVLLAVTPLFAAGPLGAGEAAVGIAMGSFSVTTLLLRPWAGRWTDRHGRRLLLVGGALLSVIGIVAHHLVTSLILLVSVRVLLGAAEALYFVAGFAALADLAPPGRTGEALSVNSLALFIGLAAGPMLGQGLLHWGGFELAWVGAAVLALVAAAAASRVPETRPVSAPGSTPAGRMQQAVLAPGVALFSGVAATSGFLAFSVLQARGVGIEAWSVVLLLFGVTVVALRLVLARLPDRVPPLRLAAAALGVAAAGSIVVGTIRTPAGLVAGTVLLAVATAFLTPAIFAAVFSAVPADQRGGAAATTSIFIDLGLGGGPVLTGLIASATSVSTAFLLIAALPMAGTCLLLTLLRRALPHRST